MIRTMRLTGSPVPLLGRIAFGGVLVALLFGLELKHRTLIYVLVVTALYGYYVYWYIARSTMRVQAVYKRSMILPMALVGVNILLFISLPLYFWITADPPRYSGIDSPVPLLSIIYNSLYGCYGTIDNAVWFYSIYVVPFMLCNLWAVNRMGMVKYALFIMLGLNVLLVDCWNAMIENSLISVLRIVGE